MRDLEGKTVLGGISYQMDSYQMDWGQCKQKGRPFPSSVLWRVYPNMPSAPLANICASGEYLRASGENLLAA